jgi:hypothetical protein
MEMEGEGRTLDALEDTFREKHGGAGMESVDARAWDGYEHGGLGESGLDEMF